MCLFVMGLVMPIFLSFLPDLDSFRKIKRLLKKPPLYQLVGGGWGKQGVVGGEMQSGSRSVWSAVAAVSLLSPAHVPMATSNGKVAVLGASQSAPDPSTRRSQDDVLAGELLLHQGGLRHQVQHHDQGQQGVVQGSGDKCWSWKASLHCCEIISIYRIKKLAPTVLLWHCK